MQNATLRCIKVVFVSEGLTYVHKDAPREKKALTFFRADISFFQ